MNTFKGSSAKTTEKEGIMKIYDLDQLGQSFTDEMQSKLEEAA